VYVKQIKNGNKLHRSGLLVALLLGLAITNLAWAASAKKDNVVRDLDYGVVLYNYFQEQYFEAAVHLMASKELGRIPHHLDDSDLLLGGVLLSYGLHQEAESVFSRLIDEGAPPDIRDKTWFSIGKIRYQKGLQADAIRAFEQIGDSLEKDMFTESQLLLANLLMGRGEFKQASGILKKLPGHSTDATFAKYNLGISLFRSGREIEGSEFLAEVGRIKSFDPEVMALRDKANLALGYALLGQEESSRARAFFQLVRLKGPFSNKALLGFGWSHAMQKDFESALTSWMELRSRKLTDSSVYEAQLAVGYALEQLQAYPQSMQSYLEAIDLFKKEMSRLDGAMKEVRNGKLMNYLVSQALGDEKGVINEKGLLKEVPEFRFITGIVSGHQFHEAIKNLRDLQLLRNNLKHWGGAIPTYKDMLRLRRQTYEERLPELMPEKDDFRLAAFQDERALYEEEYRRIVYEHDIRAVATAKEAALLTRLDGIKGRLQKVGRRMNTNQYGDYENKYHLYRGLLEWEISTSFNQRAWNMRKGLNQLDKEIKKTETQQQTIMLAKKRAPKGFEGYDRQITRMDNRVKSLQKRIDTVYSEQQQRVQDIIIAELSWLKERLSEYMDQAQFSLARLQDIASGQN